MLATPNETTNNNSPSHYSPTNQTPIESQSVSKRTRGESLEANNFATFD